MVIESSQQPVKRGRGRPRKNPLPDQAPAAKESKKSKSHHAASSLSREEELAAFEKRSNKSGILTLLVLLLGIALIGYGMYLKLHQADRLDDDMPTNTDTNVENQFEDADTEPTGNNLPAPPAPTAGDATLIHDYFTRINAGQFDTLAQIQDTSFRTLATLRNYFNRTRLETFAKNTTNGIRVEGLTENTTDPALKRNPALSPKAYDFTMVYTLKSDSKEYRDLWRAYTVQKGTGVVINGFVYQGTGISQSPFFQFSKFGIK